MINECGALEDGTGGRSSFLGCVVGYRRFRRQFYLKSRILGEESENFSVSQVLTQSSPVLCWRLSAYSDMREVISEIAVPTSDWYDMDGNTSVIISHTHRCTHRERLPFGKKKKHHPYQIRKAWFNIMVDITVLLNCYVQRILQSDRADPLPSSDSS